MENRHSWPGTSTTTTATWISIHTQHTVHARHFVSPPGKKAHNQFNLFPIYIFYAMLLYVPLLTGTDLLLPPQAPLIEERVLFMHHHTIECATPLAKCSCCHGWWCRFMYGLIVCCPRIVHTKIVTPSPSHSPTIVLVILRRIACIHNERCVLNYPRSLNLLSPFNRPDSFIVAVLSPMHSNACKHVNTISLHKHKQTTHLPTHYIDIALLLIRSAIDSSCGGISILLRSAGHN